MVYALKHFKLTSEIASCKISRCWGKFCVLFFLKDKNSFNPISFLTSLLPLPHPHKRQIHYQHWRCWEHSLSDCSPCPVWPHYILPICQNLFCLPCCHNISATKSKDNQLRVCPCAEASPRLGQHYWSRRNIFLQTSKQCLRFYFQFPVFWHKFFGNFTIACCFQVCCFTFFIKMGCGDYWRLETGESNQFHRIKGGWGKGSIYLRKKMYLHLVLSYIMQVL